jgi:hypothetical protein
LSFSFKANNYKTESPTLKNVKLNAVIKPISPKTQTVDGGYFSQGGQLYHVYTDMAYGNIVAMYRSPGGVDGTAITTFSGYEYSGTGGYFQST